MTIHMISTCLNMQQQQFTEGISCVNAADVRMHDETTWEINDDEDSHRKFERLNLNHMIQFMKSIDFTWNYTGNKEDTRI